ncbi:MAG: XRE family transcriptional regulator, partial [Candidatus Omnitrophica bacterium]|nr:XRE family transcriptional regulator [Candidatus Omnitrophota bacterium]
MNVGEAIHKLRKEKKMTLLELSVKSGVALATLSRMENGRMTGTLESHINICKALDISLTDIYKDLMISSGKVEVEARKAGTGVFVHNKRASSEMLAANSFNKKMVPIMIKIAKGGDTHPEQTKAGTEKFIYVLDGKLEADIGEIKYKLVKGDTLYFESS